MPKSEKKTHLKKGHRYQKRQNKAKRHTKKAKKAQKQPKMDSSDTNSVIGVLITGAILLTLFIVLGLVKICCKQSRDPSDPKTQLAYPVAISNRLFNVCKCLFHCMNW